MLIQDDEQLVPDATQNLGVVEYADVADERPAAAELRAASQHGLLQDPSARLPSPPPEGVEGGPVRFVRGIAREGEGPGPSRRFDVVQGAEAGEQLYEVDGFVRVLGLFAEPDEDGLRARIDIAYNRDLVRSLLVVMLVDAQGVCLYVLVEVRMPVGKGPQCEAEILADSDRLPADDNSLGRRGVDLAAAEGAPLCVGEGSIRG